MAHRRGGADRADRAGAGVVLADPGRDAGEIEHLATLPADSSAVAALRTRILARFAELENERTAINAKLATTAPATADPALLDRLPQVSGILHRGPAELQQDLYRLFGTQMIYNHEDNQVSCYATITQATTQAATELLANCHPATTSEMSALLLHADRQAWPARRCCCKRDSSATTSGTPRGAAGPAPPETRRSSPTRFDQIR